MAVQAMVIDSGTIAGGAGSTGPKGGNGGAGVVLGNGVTGGGTLVVSGTVAGGAGAQGISASGTVGAAVRFYQTGNLLVLERHAVLRGGLAGFAAGDTIDVAHVQASTFTYAGGTLTLLGSPFQGPGEVARLVFDGHYVAADFALAGDGQGGTDILYAGPGGMEQDFLPALSHIEPRTEPDVVSTALHLRESESTMLGQIEHGLLRLLG